MFYKFIGGEDQTLLDIFEKAVRKGSIKFGSVRSFNDPFEFKFTSVAPSREAFDLWHRKYGSHRTVGELENAWAAFSGPAASWNTTITPRLNLLGSFFVLCLSRRWDSHLMWAHYANAQRGFAIRYKPEILAALDSAPDYLMRGSVQYRDKIPELRWFTSPPAETVAPFVFSKSTEWSYEAEYRVIMSGPSGSDAIFCSIDPLLIDGIILGSRSPEALIRQALAARKMRPDFRVEQISSSYDSYYLVADTVRDDIRTLSAYL